MMRPFPGLRPFGFEDRDFFFGREDQVFSLYRLLEHSRFIAVVGSSGSGKSSLVRAGLLPVIDEESQGEGGRKWRFATLHPGDAPIKALASAVTSLAQHSDEDSHIRYDRTVFALKRSSFGLAKSLDDIPNLSGKSVLLVVDQFEELFRYASIARGSATDALWRDEAANFVQLLLEATRSRSSSVYVLMTMRSDFIGDCSQFHGLPEAVSAAQFLVPSLTRDQREDVIRKPVEKASATIDSTLVELLLNDAGSDSDQLPVLQHCLARLWDRAASPSADGDARHLGLTEYEAIGGLSGALSQHADEIMASLPGLELTVEQVFRALSEVDKEGRATRRALPYARLLAETGVAKKDLQRVLDRFRADDCSFLLPSPSTAPVLHADTRVDVVHEALLRRWERISAEQAHIFDGRMQTGWLAAEAADGRLYRALLALLEAESGSSVVTLPLDQVETRWHWWKSRPRTEAWAERYGGHLASVEKLFEDSRAALDAERVRKREAEQREREQERRKIEAEQAAKRQQLEHEAEVDRMRAESAQRLTHRTRIAALAMSVIALLAVLLAIIAFREQKLSDISAANAIAQRTKADQANAVAQRMTVRAGRALHGETVYANHAAAEATIAKMALANANVQRTLAVQQSIVANQQRKEALSERSQVFLQVGRQALLNGNDDDAALLLAAAYSGDPHNAKLQLLLGQALQKLSVRPRPIQTRNNAVVTALAVNPNKKLGEIAAASTDGSAKLYTTSGRLIKQFNDQGDIITALAFDPTGRYLVTVGRDGSAKLRNLQTALSAPDPPLPLRDPKDRLEGHAGRVNSVVFSGDGKRILTSGSDGRVKIWNTAEGQMLLAWDGAAPGVAVNDALFDPRGRVVAACAADGSLGIWDSRTGYRIASSTVSSKSPLVRLAISPTGGSVVAGALDGTVAFFDIATKQFEEWHNQHAAITAIAFDAAGGRILSASNDGTSVIFDATTGKPIKTLSPRPGAPAVLTASFSPSGNGIETTYADGSVNLWTQEGEPVLSFSSPTGAAVVAGFAPNGSLLVTGGDDGSIYTWQSSSPLLRAAYSHRSAVESIEFDRRGERMLTASEDGTAVLWRIGSEPQVLGVLHHGSGSDWVVAAHFSADGQRILTAGGDAVKIWGADSTSAGARPLFDIHTTAPSKRFSQASFIGQSYDVITAQTDTSLANPAYKSNGWVAWTGYGNRKAKQRGWQSGIRQLIVSRDGSAVLAISANGYASISPIDGRKTYETWRGVAEGIPLQVGFAVGGAKGILHVLNSKGAEVRSWPSNDDRVVAFALSDDSKWFATGGNGGKAGTIWDLGEPRLSHVALGGNEGEIESASFSPGAATFLIATASDGTVKLWDRASGDLVATVSVPGSRATSAVFTPDGSAVVIGAENGSVFVWQLRRGIPSPQAAASLVLRESDRSGVSDPLVSQAIDVLRKVPVSGH